MKSVHWPLMGGLLHIVQRGGDWARPQPIQDHPRCTKCNSRVGIAGGLGGGFNPPVNVFNPLVVLFCLSWGGVRNSPHGSQLQTLICHHIPQVIEPCRCCQAYVPYPQSAKDASCSCSAFSQNTFWASACTVTVLLCY